MDDTEFELAHKHVKGRGTGALTKGRYEKLEISFTQEEAKQIATQVYKDASRSIIARNDSPDVGFSASLNAYRGCEHGCIYCYARPTHEYLGLSAGLDFETKIFAKMDAPQLLAKELESKSWRPHPLGMSGVTDCYQPLERKLQLTRQCLEILVEYRNPVVIITKNHLVTRDIDLLRQLAEHNAVRVIISITTLDAELARRMEPRASHPQRRLDAIRELHAANIPVGVNMSPIVVGLTDHEIPSVLKSASEAGAAVANYALVRLPYGVKDIFSGWLEQNYASRKEKVLHRIQEVRGGRLNSSEFGTRMRGEGTYAQHIAQMFAHYKKLYHLNRNEPLSTKSFRRRGPPQLSLL